MVQSNDPGRVNMGKDIGPSIGWITLPLFRMWMVFTRARAVVARNSLLF